MLRASSEIAVATRVAMAGAKPSCDARARPRIRAVTMSESDSTLTRVSSATSTGFIRQLRGTSSARNGLAATVEIVEALLQVERGRDPLQRQAHVDHRERHVRLDADDHGFGAP